MVKVKRFPQSQFGCSYSTHYINVTSPKHIQTHTLHFWRRHMCWHRPLSSPLVLVLQKKKSHLILIKSKWSMKCLVISIQKPSLGCLFSLQQVWNSNTRMSPRKLKEALNVPRVQSGELVILFLAKHSAIIKQQLPFIILSFPFSLQLHLTSAPGNKNMWHAAECGLQRWTMYRKHKACGELHNINHTAMEKLTGYHRYSMF